MNFPTIQLNETAALKANTGGGAFFDGNSEQLVKIGRAEFVVSPNTGTTGMAFDVFNKDGQKGYFTLWFLKTNGEYVDGFYNQLQSIMAVTGVNTLTPTQANIDKWDTNAGRNVPTQMTVANELMGKYFTGLFINEFEIYNGEKKTKTQLFAAFNQKRQSLQEQKDQAAPQQIETQKERMMTYSSNSENKVDEQLKNSGGNGGYNNQTTGQPPHGGASYQRTSAPAQNNSYQNNNAPNNQPHSSTPPGPVDDDIPFAPHFDGQF